MQLLSEIKSKANSFGRRKFLHLDYWLFGFLLLLMVYGVMILASASGGNWSTINSHIIRLVLSCLIILFFAQIPPRVLHLLAPWVFAISIVLLVLVILFGDVGKGARRWLDLGLFSFQPSEIAKIALPLMMSWFFSEVKLPPSFFWIIISLLTIAMPTALVILQPDLGTAIIIALSGLCIIFLVKIHWVYILSAIVLVASILPLVWGSLHVYQQQRVLTFFNPESDPLGSGYHIIQSKIAIGSGGLSGKGWFEGSQAQFNFLPESTTDFIFAVMAEEIGFVGVLILLTLYMLILIRCWIIAYHAQGNFARLLSASFMMILFLYIFINIGMVSGILPVVGVPLPFVSYGGTSLITLSISLGIIMSINSNRRMMSDE